MLVWRQSMAYVYNDNQASWLIGAQESILLNAARSKSIICTVYVSVEKIPFALITS